MEKKYEFLNKIKDVLSDGTFEGVSIGSVFDESSFEGIKIIDDTGYPIYLFNNLELEIVDDYIYRIGIRYDELVFIDDVEEVFGEGELNTIEQFTFLSYACDFCVIVFKFVGLDDHVMDISINSTMFMG
ncbi:hypothetical protein WMW72_34345 [Paenibacillus filicis]|uniref:Uncharacterized protein n=1 Tax=Paenibacillus filicis TaxID=669464 RepID=A0ABU9DXV8_9BACL